jgi:glutamyl-tRNA synthetase
MHIRAMSPEELRDRIIEAGFAGDRASDPDLIVKIIPLVQERMKTLSDFLPKTEFFFHAMSVSLEDFKKVKKSDKEIAEILKQGAQLIKEAGTLESQTLEPLLRDLAMQMEIKPGQLFMALRVAVTGSSVSPPLLESMEVLGLETCTARLNEAADSLLSQ